MSRLECLQADFAEALNQAASGPDIARNFSGDLETVLGRLAIYRGNVQANAVKALASAYPVIEKIVGREFFAALSRAYIRATPSSSGNLNELGAGFAEFLAGFEHARELPYLADVARLEWLLHLAHFAAHAEPLDTAALAKVPAESQGALRFVLHPAAAWLASEYPLARICEVNRHGYAGEMAIEPLDHRQYLLVSRPKFRAGAEVIDGGTYVFLDRLARVQPLSVAVTEATAADAMFDLPGTLVKLNTAGVITGFRLAAG